MSVAGKISSLCSEGLDLRAGRFHLAVRFDGLPDQATISLLQQSALAKAVEAYEGLGEDRSLHLDTPDASSRRIF